MKNLFLILLYTLTVALPLSLNATELRQRLSHRPQVLKELNKRQCLQIYSGLPVEGTSGVSKIGQIADSSTGEFDNKPVIRSATRGVTRGARSVEPISRQSTSRPFLAEIFQQIENFSLRFQALIKVEFGLPFGGGDNLTTFQYLIRDKYESKEKFSITKKLGLKWNGSDEPSVCPDWITLATNYRKAQADLGIAENDSFVPVMVFYKEIMVTKDGKLVPGMDYRFVDPLKEDINGLTAEWKILTSDVQFNLPFSAMMEAMKKGLFPMLDAVHDIYHFVSFLRFPEATKALRRALDQVSVADYSSGFKRREYWLTEALSLVFPESQQANSEFLRINRGRVRAKSIKQIRLELGQLKESDLIEYSLKLANHMGSQLRDVSGGNSSPAEKWFYLGDIVGVPGRALVDNILPEKQDLTAVTYLSDSYFRNGPVLYAGNPKPMTNETATFSFSTFNMAHRLLAQALGSNFRDHFKRRITKKQLLQDLLEYSARTEFLIRSEQPTIQSWYENFLTKDMDPNGPIGQLLTTVFGNEIVTRFYLGEGEKRPGP